MIHIFQGIKDYCKDCWRDFWYWFWDLLYEWVSERSARTYCWRYNEGRYTKEGSVWHYIQQRRITKQKDK